MFSTAVNLTERVCFLSRSEVNGCSRRLQGQTFLRSVKQLRHHIILHLSSFANSGFEVAFKPVWAVVNLI